MASIKQKPFKYVKKRTKTSNEKLFIRNVLNSVGYISVTAIKSIDPDISNYVRDQASTIKDAFESVKDFKNIFNSKMDDVKGSSTFQLGKDFANNAWEDLRSGKFYNPGRQQKNEDAFMKQFTGFDMDDFDDLDFADLDDEDDDKSVHSTDVYNASNQITGGIQSGAMSATTNLINNSRHQTENINNNNNRGFRILNTSINGLTSSVLSMQNAFSKPLSDHIINSTKFYEAATVELSKQTQLLESINANLTEYLHPQKAKNQKESKYESLFGYGTPGLSEIGSAVKNNFQNGEFGTYINMVKDMAETLEMLRGTEEFNSPIGYLIGSGIGKLIGSGKTGRALNRFKKDFRLKLIKGAGQVHQKARGDGIMGFLAKLFDVIPENRDNGKINVGKYDKGPTRWTGMNDMALRKVIPETLVSILYALTKNPEDIRLFNYDTGKWEKKDKVMGNRLAKKIKNAANAASDYTEDFVQQYADENGLDAGGYKAKLLRNDADIIVAILGMSNINPMTCTKNDARKILLKYVAKNGRAKEGQQISSMENLDLLLGVFFDNTRSRANAQMISGVYAARDANNKYIENEDAFMNAASIQNGSVINNAGTRKIKGNKRSVDQAAEILGVDNHGHSLFYYLQRMTKEIATISYYTQQGAGFGGGGNGAPINPNHLNQYISFQNKRATVITPGYQGNSIAELKQQGALRSAGRIHRKNKNDGILKPDLTEAELLKQVQNGTITQEEYDRIINQRRQERYNAELRRDTLGKSIIDDFGPWLDKRLFGNAKDAVKKSFQEKGLFGFLADIPSLIGRGLKTIFSDVKNRFTNSEFGQRYLGKLKEAPLEFFKDIGKNTYKKAKKRIKGFLGQYDDGAFYVPSAYDGGEVTRSGLVSVSEGEVILPAEMNPNYRGYISKGKRKDIERKNARDYYRHSKGAGSYLPYWGEFAEGGTATARLTDEEKKELKNELLKRQRLNKHNKKKIENRTRRANDTSNFGRFSHALIDSEPVQDISNVLYGIYDKLIEITGGDAKSAERKEKVKSVWDEVKDYLPETLAGGTIGGVIGGVALGPLGILGGFTVGAGVNLINHSEKISNSLFGEYDEKNDEWKGGKLPKGVSNFIKKELPGYAKAGGIGSILGALGVVPGGVLGGFAIGAGINAIKGSETFKELLFGSEGLDGKRRGGLVGELKYTIVDPLKDWAKDQIGDKGKNIKNYFKENLFKPVKHLGIAMKDLAKGLGKDTLSAFQKLTKTAYVKLGDIIQHTTNPIIRGVGKAGAKAWEATKAVGKLPGKLVNKAAGEIDIMNIRKGYSSMSAAERLAMAEERYGGAGFLAETDANPDDTHTTDVKFRFGRKKVGVDAYDKWAASASVEDLEQANIFENGESEVENQIFEILKTCQSTLQASLINGGNNPKRSGRGTYNKDIQEFFSKPKYVGKALKAQRNAGIKTNKVYAEVKGINKILNDAVRDGQMSKELRKMADKFISDQFPKLNKLIDKWWDYDIHGVDSNNEWAKTEAGKAYLATQTKDKKIQGRHKKQLALDLENMKKREGPSEAFKAFKDIEDDEKAKELAKEAVANDPVESRKMSLLEVIKVSVKDVAEGVKALVKEPIVNAATSVPLGAAVQDYQLELPGPTIHQDKNGRWRDEKGHFVKAPTSNATTSVAPHNAEQAAKAAAENRKHEANATPFDEPPAVIDNNPQLPVVYNAEQAAKQEVIEQKQEAREEERSSFYRFFTDKKNGLMTKLSGFLNGFSGKEGEDSKSTGILGLLGNLGSIFSGGISSILTKIGSLAGLLSVGAIAAGAVGLHKYGESTAGTSVDADVRKGMTEDDIQALKDEKANRSGLSGYLQNTKSGMDALENKLTGKDMTTYEKDDYVSEYTSNRINKAMLLNTAVRLGSDTFKNSIIGAKGVKAVYNAITPKVVKNGAKVLKSAKNVIGGAVKRLSGTKAGQAVGKAAASVVNKIKDKAFPIFQRLLSKLGLNNVDDAATSIAQEVSENVAKKGGSSLASGLSKVCTVLTVAQIVLAFEDGMENAQAKTILQIIDEPSFVARLVAASIHALNTAIPVIGGIIPTHILFTIVYKVLQLVGIKIDGLEEQRQNAKDTVEAYNKEHGTTYNIEEYIHNVLGEYTTQQKVKGFFGKVGTGIKNFFTGKNKKEETTTDATTDVTTTTTTTTTSTGKSVSAGVDETNPTSGGNIHYTTTNTLNERSGEGSGIRYAGRVNYVGGKSDVVGYVQPSKFKQVIGKAADSLSYSYNNYGVGSLFNGKAQERLENTTNSIKEGATGLLGSIKNIGSKIKEKTLDAVMRALVSPVKAFFNVIGDTLFQGIYEASKRYPLFVTTIEDPHAGEEKEDKADGEDSGSGSHVSQMELGNRRFGNSTVASSGCGPAVAATVLRQYGRSGDLGRAASYAEHNGYVAGSSGVGTKAGYFRDILGNSGIATSYTSSKRGISSAIGSGNPTILLGRDAGNHSKANSPFGPNPHYVVARGAGNGSVIVDDPELGSPAIYSRSAIEKGANLGIATGAGSSIFNMRGAGTLEITEKHGAVWNYLKSLGLTDAGAAALMGNVQHESGMKFNSAEGQMLTQTPAKANQGHDYYNDFGIKYDSDSYTAAVDAGMKQGLEGSESTNNNPKQGVISKYEFLNMPWRVTNPNSKRYGKWGQNGYGLCQWTTAGRKEGLYNLAKANNKSISDPTVQLQFLLNELQSGYSGVYNTLKSSNDVDTAAKSFYYNFEGPPDSDTSYPTRLSYAKAFYDQFTKNPPSSSSDFGSLSVTQTVDTGTTSSGTSSSSGVSSSSGSFSLKDMYRQAFGSIFSKVGENSTNENDKSFFGKLGTSLTNLFNGNTSSAQTADTVSAVTSAANSTVTPSYGGIANSYPKFTSPTANAVVGVARSQLGVTEGGENNAGNITDYGKFLGMDAQPWCASFVSWVFDKAAQGDAAKRKALMRGAMSASVSGLWDNFKAANAMTNDPQPGDVIIFKNNGASHTGIVESVTGKTITSIEGNTGSSNEYERNGGVVARHTWTIGDGSTLDKKTTGFGRPDWNAVSGGKSGIIDFRKSNYEKRIGGASGVDNTELMEKLATIIKLLTSGVQGDVAIVEAIKSLSAVTASTATGQEKEVASQVSDQMDIMIAKLNKISTSL